MRHENMTHTSLKVRNSNIEILRILAMFMVLMLHVNFMTIGEPTTAESVTSPLPTFFRVFFQLTANIAVNLFVLISGWFGIRFSYRGLCKFLFQCIFIVTLMYLMVCIGLTTLEPKLILECLFLENNGWFVKAYLALFILSPVLNVYCNNSDEALQRRILIYFFVFQTIFGAFTMSAKFIQAGFSTFSFLGLYLLAKYMHQYGMRYTKYSKYIFIISIIGQVLWFYIPLRIGILRISYMSILYTSPLCITAALGLLMWFTSFKPRHNHVINFIAASCFSVYLCHICNSWTTDWFLTQSRNIYNSYSGIKYLIAIFTFICGVFLLSILIDQIRKLSWSLIDGLRSSKKRPITDVIQ